MGLLDFKPDLRFKTKIGSIAGDPDLPLDELEQILMEGVNKPKQVMFNQLMRNKFIMELMKYFPVQDIKRK